MKKYWIALFLLVAITKVDAQPLNRITLPVMIETAERAMADYNYYKALEWYKKAYESSEDKALLVKMADLNYSLRDYEEAEKYYGQFFKETTIADLPNRRFEYARTLKMNGKYPEAIEQLKIFEASNKDSRLSHLAQAEIKGAEYGLKASADKKLTVTNAGSAVNTKSSEYSPFLLKEGTEMYFASFGDNEILELDRGSKEGFGAKILVSQKEKNGWAAPTALGNNINRPGYFTSNLTLSPDGQQLFFARQLLTEGNKLKESKLYTCTKEAEGWGEAREVTDLNGDFLVKSPAIGELFGKKVLFFVSNKAEGYGGYDIYYATSTGENTFSQAINLGPTINTSGEEETPFYQNGNLYFSSTGHPGLGGYDIFKCNWNGSEWSSPENIGPGYNSSVDDLSFMLDESGAEGLLTSNRIDKNSQSLKNKTCCNDIYSLSIKQIKLNLLASAVDSKTNEALPIVNIQLFMLENGSPELQSSQLKTTEPPLYFDLIPAKAFRLIATAENYHPDTLDFNTVGFEESTSIEQLLRLAAIPPKPEYVTITREEPITLENIYYDFNAATIRQDAEQDLNFLYGLLQKYPTMVIELASHTDSRGNAAYNLSLSQRRAESARQWLLNKGIAPQRVIARGYGKTLPKTIDDKLAAIHSFLPFGTVLIESYINTLGSE